MYTVSTSIVMTVLVLNIRHRSQRTHYMSRPVCSFSLFRLFSHFQLQIILLHWLPWLLLMSRPGHVYNKKLLPNIVNTNEQQSTIDEHRSNSVRRQFLRSRRQHLLSTVTMHTRITDCLHRAASTIDNVVGVAQLAQLLLLEQMHRDLSVCVFDFRCLITSAFIRYGHE